MAFAIVNCRLFDGSSQAVKENATIIVDDDKVKFVAEGVSGDAEVPLKYDGSGLTVLPGLIDTHVHFGHNPELKRSSMRVSAVEVTLNALANLGYALRHGITTVRDLGCGMDISFDVKKAWQSKRFTGARPYVSGGMITATGGHGTESGLRSGIEVDGTVEIVKAVRREVSKGADVIKLVTCGTARRTELTFEELLAATTEAHWLGVPVACHAHIRRRSILNAIRAGCDSLEHGFLLDDEIIGEMLERKTYYCPTLAVVQHILQHPDEYGGTGTRFYRTMVEMAPRQQASFRLALEASVPIIGGTDAGLPTLRFDALHEELSLMTSLGMSTAAALKSVTGVAAEALGCANKLGHLRAGVIADFIVVEGDPLSDITLLRHPLAVYQEGRLAYGAPPPQCG
jgi:imidazolonepropionase-like amidohydrolase